MKHLKKSILVLLAMIFALSMVMVGCGMAIINFGGAVVGSLLHAGTLIIPAGILLVVLVYYGSWLISVRIYEKKDL